MLCKTTFANQLILAVRLGFRRNLCSSVHLGKNSEEQSQVEFDVDQEELGDEDFESLTVDSFRELIQTPDDEQRIRQILDEYEYMKYTSDDVPRTISVRFMSEMLKECPTAPSRTKFFLYLRKREQIIAEVRRDKRKIREAHQRMLAERKPYPPGTLFDEDNRPIHRRWHNALFLQISEQTIDRCHDYKKRVAAMFGQKFIVDLGFEEAEKSRTAKFIGYQLALLYAHNYKSKEPFDLIFSDFKPSSPSGKKIVESNASLYEPRTMITLDERPFDELGIPREKLVYLTQFSRHAYQEVDEDDVLVVPGIYEKNLQTPITLARAKKKGVRTLFLPFTQHVSWKGVPKSVYPYQIIDILTNYKSNGRNWHKAIVDTTVSQKIKSPEEVFDEEMSRKKKIVWSKKKFFQIKNNYNS